MKLADHYDELRAAIQALEPGTEPKWGTMTPGDLLAHLLDTYRIALKEAPLDFTVPAPKWLMKWIVIYCPIPWPKGKVKAPPAYLSSAPGDLEEDKQRLLDYTRRFIETDEVLRDHSAFGKMTKDDWDHLLYRHFQHHFRQFGLWD